MGIWDWFTRNEPPKSSLNEDIGNPTASAGNSMHESYEFAGSGNMQYEALQPGVLGAGNFIGDSFYDTGGIFGNAFGRNPGLAEIEKSYIMNQRAIALYPEVAIGIEEIMRDLFIKGDAFEVIIPSGESDEFSRAREIFEVFKKNPFTVLGQNAMPDSLVIFNFLKQAYIDGRIMVLSLLVDEEKIKDAPLLSQKVYDNGFGFSGVLLNESFDYNKTDSIWFDPRAIQERDLIQLLESSQEPKRKSKRIKETPKDTSKVRIFIPVDPLRVQETGGKWFYGVSRGSRVEVKRENLIMSDFGLFDVTGARHGFLLYAFKYANQLQELQDMLIPMRFRRSVARRVFNVDIANLPQARAKAYMEDLMRKFKYKKHYDATSGKIVSKTNEPTGIVEDYWFANRSGNKGTSVETIDEAGNFQDSLDDITYFNKKLYQSMFIPLRRIFESDATYDYTANSIEVDELRFVNFLDRVRFVFDATLTQMFHVMLKDAGIDTSKISVQLKYDDWYSAAKVREDFQNSLDLYSDAKEYMGKIFSAETLISKVFGMTADELAGEFEKIKGELKEDSPFYALYQANDE